MRLLGMSLGLLVVVAFQLGCAPPAVPPGSDPGFEVIAEDLPGALLSVYAPSPDNVWAVGSDPGDGLGPMVLRYDGSELRRLSTGASHDLWWVAPGGDGDTLWMSGANGLVLRCSESTETCTNKSVGGGRTFFGIIAFANDDVWAVGGDITGANGFHSAFHFDGAGWTEVTGWPESMDSGTTFFKIWGPNSADLTIVGTRGVMLHYDGSAWTQREVGTTENLITVHGDSARVMSVGGLGSGLLLVDDGDGFQAVDLGSVPQINGLFLRDGWPAVAAGARGYVIHETDAGWVPIPGAPDTFYDYHAVSRASDGSVWAVGGNIMLPPLKAGMLIKYTPEG